MCKFYKFYICAVVGVIIEYPLFFSDFNETWIFQTGFRKILKLQTSLKFVQWEQSFSMRTDRRTNGQSCRSFSQFCERPRKYKISARFYKGLLLSIICRVCVACTFSYWCTITACIKCYNCKLLRISGKQKGRPACTKMHIFHNFVCNASTSPVGLVVGISYAKHQQCLCGGSEYVMPSFTSIFKRICHWSLTGPTSIQSTLFLSDPPWHYPPFYAQVCEVVTLPYRFL